MLKKKKQQQRERCLPGRRFSSLLGPPTQPQQPTHPLPHPQESFEHIQDWLNEVNRYASEGTCKLLVGNKSDRHDKVVSTEKAKVRKPTPPISPPLLPNSPTHPSHPPTNFSFPF